MQQTIKNLQFVVKQTPLTFDAVDARTARLLCAIGTASVLGEPVASVEVLAVCERVAVARVKPVRDSDPIMPVILANVPGDWYKHLRVWWDHQTRFRGDWMRSTRKQWYRDGQEIIRGMMACIRPCLSPDEFRFLSLELSAALAVPGAR